MLASVKDTDFDRQDKQNHFFVSIHIWPHKETQRKNITRQTAGLDWAVHNYAMDRTLHLVQTFVDLRGWIHAFKKWQCKTGWLHDLLFCCLPLSEKPLIQPTSHSTLFFLGSSAIHPPSAKSIRWVVLEDRSIPLSTRERTKCSFSACAISGWKLV